MALKRYQETFGSVLANGDVFVLAGASVEVRDETSGALAAIFSDRAGNTAKANPFTADSNGYGFFYAADGRYRVTATLSGETVDVRDVLLGVGSTTVTTSTGEQTVIDALDDRVAKDNTLLNIKDFGVLGDGSDETVSIQSAFDAAVGKALFIPDGVYAATGINIPGSLRVVGEGDGSVLKQVALSNKNFIQPTAINSFVEFSNLTLDQNSDNQTYGSGKFLFNSEQANTSVSFREINFSSYCEGATRMVGDKSESTRETLSLEACRLHGGQASTSGSFLTFTVFVADGAELEVVDCDFDHGLSTIGDGISGIAIAGVDTTSASYTKVKITGNRFKGYGRFTTGSGVGVIDAYAWAEEMVVSDNRFISSYVTPIRGKVNARNLTITGNQLTSFVDIGSEYGGGIHIVSATLTPVAGRYLISDNIIVNCPYRGIEISDSSTEPRDILIHDNLIIEPGDIGIYLNRLREFNVHDNVIRGATLQAIAFTNCTGLGRICSNIIHTAGDAGIGSIGSQLGLSITVSENQIFQSTASGIIIENIDQITMSDNTVRSVIDGGALGQRGYRLGGTDGVQHGVVKDNIAIGTFASGQFQISSAGVINIYQYGNSWDRRERWSFDPPTTGTWSSGDVTWNTSVSAGGNIGWVCTTSGSPGTWKTFGAIAS